MQVETMEVNVRFYPGEILKQELKLLAESSFSQIMDIENEEEELSCED